MVDLKEVSGDRADLFCGHLSVSNLRTNKLRFKGHDVRGEAIVNVRGSMREFKKEQETLKWYCTRILKDLEIQQYVKEEKRLMGIQRNISRGEEQHVEKGRLEPNLGKCLGKSCLVMFGLGAE